jgi:hypothetical protein
LLIEQEKMKKEILEEDPMAELKKEIANKKVFVDSEMQTNDV